MPGMDATAPENIAPEVNALTKPRRPVALSLIAFLSENQSERPLDLTDRSNATDDNAGGGQRRPGVLGSRKYDISRRRDVGTVQHIETQHEISRLPCSPS